MPRGNGLGGEGGGCHSGGDSNNDWRREEAGQEYYKALPEAMPIPQKLILTQAFKHECSTAAEYMGDKAFYDQYAIKHGFAIDVYKISSSDIQSGSYGGSSHYGDGGEGGAAAGYHGAAQGMSAGDRDSSGRCPGIEIGGACATAEDIHNWE